MVWMLRSEIWLQLVNWIMACSSGYGLHVAIWNLIVASELNHGLHVAIWNLTSELNLACSSGHRLHPWNINYHTPPFPFYIHLGFCLAFLNSVVYISPLFPFAHVQWLFAEGICQSIRGNQRWGRCRPVDKAASCHCPRSMVSHDVTSQLIQFLLWMNVRWKP